MRQTEYTFILSYLNSLRVSIDKIDAAEKNIREFIEHRFEQHSD